jgi:hypothetical protein
MSTIWSAMLKPAPAAACCLGWLLAALLYVLANGLICMAFS